ncbi:hypothetical protein [Cellulomonas timonensis]|uniref:hypothetical protein n=1 Tax=Cellulomonas timonensis TaxID=1689271 RepID=UPI000AFDE903|nr:hypothetical protein [Cellulomonas timonensis]
MSAPMSFLLAAVASLAVAVVLLTVGLRQVGAARRVDRVRLPARLLHRPWWGSSVVVVEYPAPDGSPLVARMKMFFVYAPGVSYEFDGTVWANRDDPTDVTPRQTGRVTAGAVVAIVGATFLLVAFGTGLASAIIAASESITAA